MTREHLPAGFTLTQTALRTYLECPYRFRLRYLDRVAWPSFPPEPDAETARERGQRFHELARQSFLGLDVTAQVEAAGEEVARWWAALQASPPDLSPYPQRYTEAGLSIPLGPYRLAARYDLLAVGDSAALVVDWKTGRTLPLAAQLAGAIQTRVYLYVLAEGGAAYHDGRAFPSEALAMLYWFVQGPRLVRLPYSPEQRDRDCAFLHSLVEEIAARPREDMGRVEDETTCGRCSYAPLCGRPGGAPEEWEPEEDLFPEEMELWPPQ